MKPHNFHLPTFYKEKKSASQQAQSRSQRNNLISNVTSDSFYKRFESPEVKEPIPTVTLSSWRSGFLQTQPQRSGKRGQKDRLRALIMPSHASSPSPSRSQTTLNKSSKDFISINKESLAAPDPKKDLKLIKAYVRSDIFKCDEDNEQLFQKRKKLPAGIHPQTAKLLFGSTPDTLEKQKLQEAKILPFFRKMASSKSFFLPEMTMAESRVDSLSQNVRDKIYRLANKMTIILEGYSRCDIMGEEGYVNFIKQQTKLNSPIRYILLDFGQESPNKYFSGEFLENCFIYGTVPSVVQEKLAGERSPVFYRLNELGDGKSVTEGTVVPMENKHFVQANVVLSKLERLLIELDDLYQKLREHLYSVQLNPGKHLRYEFIGRQTHIERMSKKIIEDPVFKPNSINRRNDVAQRKLVEDFEAYREFLTKGVKVIQPVEAEGLGENAVLQLIVNNQMRQVSSLVHNSLEAMGENLNKQARPAQD